MTSSGTYEPVERRWISRVYDGVPPPGATDAGATPATLAAPPAEPRSMRHVEGA